MESSRSVPPSPPRGVQVAPSAYWVRKTPLPSMRSQRDEEAVKEIERLHQENYEAFGARKMHVVLNRLEEQRRHGLGPLARCTIERLMRREGLCGIRRTRKPNTTRSALRQSCPLDLVDRHFSAFASKELWVADITYVHTFSGWVYVAFVTDVYSRPITWWQTSTSLNTDLALDALNMAIWQRGRDGQTLKGLAHHSDRGVQYRALRYGQVLADEEAIVSVGSKGDSYDNALVEAFNSLYKAELIRNKGPWRSIDDVEIATAEWVHWFNTNRPHSSIRMHTTIEHEQAYRKLHPGKNKSTHPSRSKPDKIASTKPGA